MKISKEVKKIALLILLLLIFLFIFLEFGGIQKTSQTQTNITTTTRPFQENVSIKVPENVTQIGRKRIRIV
ncbi:MAG: hypothetical protein QW040_01540 [Candidatus Aenigmatarchaeota archaeon]